MPVCAENSGISSSEQSFVTHQQDMSSTTLPSNMRHSAGSSIEVVPPPFSISSMRKNSTRRQPQNLEDSADINPIRKLQHIITQSNSAAPIWSTVPNPRSILSPNYHMNGRISLSQHVDRQPTSFSVSPARIQLLASSRYHAHPRNANPSIEAWCPQVALASTNAINPNGRHQSSHHDSQELSRDPLVSFLANILFPRVQIVGPPRTNEDLVRLLISEWHASPETGRDDEYQRLQHILIARHSRPTPQQQQQQQFQQRQQQQQQQQQHQL